MFYGGGQERNYRPGTENTGMIAGLGEACRLVTENIQCYERNMENVGDVWIFTKYKHAYVLMTWGYDNAPEPKNH